MRRPLSSGALALALLGVSSTASAAITERGFIDRFLTVPSSVTTFLGTVFPEQSAVGTSFLSPTFDPNLLVTAAAKVRVTFLWEGAGYKNTFGYFTYTTSGGAIQIVDRQLVFPNASFADPNKGWGGGQLATGDTVTLRDAAGAERVFEPGTRIGFFVVANGWSNGLGWWNAANPAVPSLSPAANNGVATGVFTTLDELNPENALGRSDVARHAAMVRVAGTPGFLDGSDYLAIGMEDQRRSGGSDNDFNDVLFLLQSTPETSILQTSLPQVSATNNDPDGDGCVGLQDYFPSDPARCFVTRSPATGYSTLVYEDLYPGVGDKDFNDAVVQSTVELVKTAANTVREIVGTYHLVARGAGLDHAFGVVIEGAPAGATGTVSLERFGSDGTESGEADRPLSTVLKADRDGQMTLRIEDIFPSTRQALPSPGSYANTMTSTPTLPPASARFRIVFDTPVNPLALAAAPYDPYLAVKHPDGAYDIHLVGKKPLPGRPASLPEETGLLSFLNPDEYPWAMVVPSTFRYPLERVPVDSPSAAQGAYPDFSTWRSSLGTQKTDWYKNPTTTANRVANSLSEGARTRPWTVTPGG